MSDLMLGEAPEEGGEEQEEMEGYLDGWNCTACGWHSDLPEFTPDPACPECGQPVEECNLENIEYFAIFDDNPGPRQHT